MHEKIVERLRILRRLGDLLQSMGIFESELGDGGSTQQFQMRPTAAFPSHFVRHRAHVGSRGNAGAETGAVDLDRQDFKLLDLNLHRL